MPPLLFTLPQPAVPMADGSGLYPVRRVFCVGRNYAAHAREMGGEPDREPPFYFTKPADSLVPGDGAIVYPPGTANLHHEVELVVAIGRPVFRATPAEGGAAVFALAVGLDMTRRDLQFAMRDAKRPWDLGKAFEQSAPISPLVRCACPPTQGSISLDVNKTRRQSGDLSEMIWPVAEIISHLSLYYHLDRGDVIFTGTPEGVGPVLPGDHLSARIEGIGALEIDIAAGE